MTSTTASVAARDETPILVRRWRPTAEPWATIVLVHGIAEHSGRYEHVGSWLADAGLDVLSFDLRGFGGSGGRRAWVNRWSEYHDDLEEQLALARKDSDGRPVVLFGHSLGGLVALGYVLAEPARPLPDALVLSAPAIDSSTPAWMRAIAPVLDWLAPRYAFKNSFDGTILSRDPTVGERYLTDPLNHHRTTARLGAEIFREQARVRDALTRLRIPTLVYHGEADALVPTATSEPIGRLPGVTRRTYPRLRHESHNEPEGAGVIADVVAWLRQTLTV